MDERFLRNEMLWGPEAQMRLAQTHVIVFGLGGVGSYAAECLARAGIGELTLVDSDTVALSNLNRQLEALTSTVGLPKAEAVARRIADINPNAVLHPLQELYNAENRSRFFPEGCRYDYIVDAIDLVSCKLDLAETARRLKIPLMMALGTGNKFTHHSCGWRTFRRHTAAPWRGSCGRNCETGESAASRWCFRRSSLRRPHSGKRRRRDGAASQPVIRGFPLWPGC